MKKLFFIILILISGHYSYATTSSGNSGVYFIGFSEQCDSIAYVKYVELYGRFNNQEDGNRYYRYYLGTYVKSLEEDTEIKVSDNLKFSLKGFSIYDYPINPSDSEEIIISKNIKQIQQSFTLKKKPGRLFFRDKEIFKLYSSVVSILHVYKHTTINKYIIHIRRPESGEYYEHFILFDGDSFKAKQVYSSPMMENASLDINRLLSE